MSLNIVASPWTEQQTHGTECSWLNFSGGILVNRIRIIIIIYHYW